MDSEHTDMSDPSNHGLGVGCDPEKVALDLVEESPFSFPPTTINGISSHIFDQSKGSCQYDVQRKLTLGNTGRAGLVDPLNSSAGQRTTVTTTPNDNIRSSFGSLLCASAPAPSPSVKKHTSAPIPINPAFRSPNSTTTTTSFLRSIPLATAQLLSAIPSSHSSSVSSSCGLSPITTNGFSSEDDGEPSRRKTSGDPIGENVLLLELEKGPLESAFIPAMVSDAGLLQSSRYKTELCPIDEQTPGQCPHGELCAYAHGPTQLRSIADNITAIRSVNVLAKQLTARMGGKNPFTAAFATVQRPTDRTNFAEMLIPFAFGNSA